MNSQNYLLVAYVDGELDAEVASEIEDLAASDPQVRHTVESFQEVNSLLRAACGESHYAGAGTRPRAKPAPASPGVYAWALAASLAMAVFGFGAGMHWVDPHSSERAEFKAEVASYHPVYARETTHLVDVPAEQMSELTGWLGERLDRTLVVPDLHASGLDFAGGRMLVVNARPVAQLMYTRDNGPPVALCLTRMSGVPTPMSFEHHGAVRLAYWEDGDFAYALVGEIEEASLHKLASRAAAVMSN